MRALKALGIAAIVFSSVCLPACSGEPQGPPAESVEVRTGALVVNQANTFGFEDPTHWTSTVAVTSSTTHTQGAKSLAVAAKNYVEVTSAALPSLTGVTGTIGLDVRLPSPQPNPYWYGFVQLLVSVPSKGVNNQFIGQVELTGKPLNQFFPVDFDLPQSLVATLQAGGYSDFRAKIVINVPFNATGNYLLDNLHFLAGAVGSADLVETNILQRWTHGSNDGPTNTTLSVLTGSQAYLRPERAARGHRRALRLLPALQRAARRSTSAPTTTSGSRRARSTPRRVGWQIAAPVIVIEDSTGARMTLSPDSNKLPIDGVTWVDFRVPLAGGVGLDQDRDRQPARRPRDRAPHRHLGRRVHLGHRRGACSPSSSTPAPARPRRSARRRRRAPPPRRVTYSGGRGRGRLQHLSHGERRRAGVREPRAHHDLRGLGPGAQHDLRLRRCGRSCRRTARAAPRRRRSPPGRTRTASAASRR